MKENTNYSKLEKIFKNNGGYITRHDVDSANISSWFLSDFVKRCGLIKIAPGFYAGEEYIVDDYYVLQERYPKYIFSGISALYLLELTDRIPTDIEVCAPQGYNPSRKKLNNLIIHRISDDHIYKLGIKKVVTMFGHVVKVYDEERTICDLIKRRDKYDSELFIKAIKNYINKTNNQSKLFKTARELGVEKKVFEVMEVLINAN